MKHLLLFNAVALLLLIAACKKDGSTIPIPVPINYAGTYFGVYEVEKNGLDSNGVFKNDSSYSYSLEIQNDGSNSISIVKGPVTVPSIIVDSTGSFSFEQYHYFIVGHFSGDSLYMSSDALKGYYDSLYYVGSSFTIVKLNFSGKKIL